MRRTTFGLAVGGVGVLCFAACSGPGGAGYTPGQPEGGLDASIEAGGGGGVGAACDAARACRPGLACTDGKCAPGHASEDGTACTISAECKQGSYCGPTRTCAPAGTGGDGAACTSDGDCGSGLRCNIVGFGAECKAEGTGDVGGACKRAGDCFGGLVCGVGACVPPPPGGPLAIPSWRGADCPADDPGPTKVYFRVPRGSNDGDFFRLPFPNDVRRKAGHPDLSGFPTPGPELLGFDVVDRYLRDVEQRSDGFSAYPTVTLRFSGDFDLDSLKGTGVVRWVDVTTGEPGDDRGWGWSATTGRSPYVCPRSMAIRPSQGAPLTPGHTYAVMLSNGAKAAGGQPLARDADLDALLSPTTPSDAALAAAHASYAPLRAWIAAKSVDAATIAGATVFTVGTQPIVSRLATAVAAAAAPTSSGWIKCGGAAASPCAQATGDRACGPVDPAFDELHALVKLPIFQSGTAPYFAPTDGGEITVDGAGTPQLQRTEDVCLALTVPKGTMPAGGWPLVIYAHGTGGSFRSHITESVASRLASVDDGAGGQVKMAVLGIDQVQHGPRRGASQETPQKLFYNFANPSAARGNPLQGAVDQMALVRFAGAFDLAAGASPTGAEIKFAPGIAFWGHSQGATVDAIALPYVTGVAGAVLSGEGASLIDALVTKKNPVNIAAALPFVLQDPSVGTSHPVLSVLQNAIDAADPLNHAAFIAKSPLTPGAAKHVFQPYGLGDTYSPPATEATFAIAAGLRLLTPSASVTAPDSIGGATATPVPVSGNLSDGVRPITAVVREYAPSGYDGHFVSFKESTAQADVAHFLADVVAGKTPNAAR
ncbi:MAG: hypothetical protein JWM74_6069 [Myxococcaceae bacterium]|nr:hypothetical protein [Myxococcaceae bacterium]